MFGGLVHEPALTLADAADGDGPAGTDARLLLGFRIDRRRGRAQDRAAILAQHGADPGRTVSSASPTAITATPSARWRSPTRKSRCTRRFRGDPGTAIRRRYPADEASLAELDALLGHLAHETGGDDHRAAGAGRGRHAVPPPRDPGRPRTRWRRSTTSSSSPTRSRPDSGGPGTGSPARRRTSAPTSSAWARPSPAARSTMGATLATEEIFASFLSDDWDAALMHGPTFMANPLACAAANASLDLFEREPREEQVKADRRPACAPGWSRAARCPAWSTCESTARSASCSSKKASTSMRCGPGSWNRASGFGPSRISST